MIITKPKPLEEVLEYIKNKERIYITGCTLCATTCQTGGEKELQAMKKILEDMGKSVTGTCVLDPSCHKLQVRSTLKKEKEALKDTEAILCMACGDGAQTVAGLLDIPVYPVNDTLFIGEIERLGHYTEACRACGKCELGWSAGICPITKCAKSLINGPCGGAKDGKCEVNPENDCAWILIYNKLSKTGEFDALLEIKDPKDNSQFAHPRRLMPEK